MLDDTQIDDFLHLRLPEEKTRAILTDLTPGNVDAALLKRFLAAVGKTVTSLPVISTPVIDCCGTGGSGLNHFNTSTASAFVLAAGGVPVVKFGNRAMSSASGSFDFLDTLGIPAEQSLEKLPDTLDNCGLVFLYAPQCYPALAPFNALRKSLGIRTVFNFMGPLLNPVSPAFRILGVSDSKMQKLMAEYLSEDTATQKAWLVRADETMDEITPSGKTQVYEICKNNISEKMLSHQESVAIPENALSPKESAAVFMDIIQGSDNASWAYHAMCLNAGAGFYVAGRAESLEAGRELAKSLLANGDVLKRVELCRRTYGHS